MAEGRISQSQQSLQMNKCTPEETIHLLDAVEKVRCADPDRNPHVKTALKNVTPGHPPEKVHQNLDTFVALIELDQEDWIIAVDRQYDEVVGWLRLPKSRSAEVR